MQFLTRRGFFLKKKRGVMNLWHHQTKYFTDVVLGLIFYAVSTLFAGCILAAEFSSSPLNVIPYSAAEQARIDKVIRSTTNFDRPEQYENNPAGAATVRLRNNNNAFSQHSANMRFDKQLDFRVGNGLFKKLWVSSPSSTLASDGLGPLYNARSCQRCHLKDGRGHPPENKEDKNISIVLRVSVSNDFAQGINEIEDYLGTSAHPRYGSQLQDLSIGKNDPEYDLDLSYDYYEIQLADKETVELRKPLIEISDLAYGPLEKDTMKSLRVAPPMIGLGLLESVPSNSIISLADPSDKNSDGISGRVQIVWSKEFKKPLIGRFGWKGGASSMLEQVAVAANKDIGLSNRLFPYPSGDCTKDQLECINSPDGNTDFHDNYEVSNDALNLITFYARNLGVPARRKIGDELVLKGKRLFYEIGCQKCHNPKFVTHRLRDQPEQSFQLIWPYTDLLLHDMGAGLADGFNEGRASGKEWKTPPLWGIGLTKKVSGHTYFLHDGRARNLLEAIIWHGGEAEDQKMKVIQMTREERTALITFLESL